MFEATIVDNDGLKLKAGLGMLDWWPASEANGEEEAQMEVEGNPQEEANK